MKRRKNIFDKNIEISWAFVMVGTLFAFLITILGNSLYEILRRDSGPMVIFLVAIVSLIVIIHFLTFFFENRKDLEDKKDAYIFYRYSKYTISSLRRRK